ncbi:MAG: (2Fe-2S)-binding protein, partial [Deltaproteobacteria bacterium]
MPRQPRIVVCSCEDVTLEDIEHSLERGYCDIESVKRFTGFSTGPCQGRHCLALVARILHARDPDAPLKPTTPRP